MMTYIYRLSDGQFLRGSVGSLDFDPATEGQEVYQVRPNLRTERHDGAAESKRRPATAQEISDYDAVRRAATEQIIFDDQKLIKALAIWTAQKLNVSLNTAKQEILAIYRGL